MQKALKEPPILDFLYVSVQKMSGSSLPALEIPSAEPKVLPSLSAALLSPPIRGARTSTANNRKLIGSPAEFHATPDFFADEASGRTRRLEDQVKEQRSRLLVFQSRWQCLLEAVQTALPQFRSELKDLRSFVADWNSSFGTQVKILPESVIREAFRLLEHERSQWREKLELERLKLVAAGQEKHELFDRIQQLELQLNDWRLKEQKWQKEKETLEADARNTLRLREEQLEKEKAESIQQLNAKHKLEVTQWNFWRTQNFYLLIFGTFWNRRKRCRKS